uniref:Uncharacterized protein n=1 Tax=Arundo donax TaxID=35708 RepID=A0A0A9HF88_ARUDO
MAISRCLGLYGPGLTDAAPLPFTSCGEAGRCPAESPVAGPVFALRRSMSRNPFRQPPASSSVGGP